MNQQQQDFGAPILNSSDELADPSELIRAQSAPVWNVSKLSESTSQDVHHDPRADPEYYQYYQTNKYLNPRLPVPLTNSYESAYRRYAEQHPRSNTEFTGFNNGYQKETPETHAPDPTHPSGFENSFVQNARPELADLSLDGGPSLSSAGDASETSPDASVDGIDQRLKGIGFSENETKQKSNWKSDTPEPERTAEKTTNAENSQSQQQYQQQQQFAQPNFVPMQRHYALRGAVAYTASPGMVPGYAIPSSPYIEPGMLPSPYIEPLAQLPSPAPGYYTFPAMHQMPKIGLPTNPYTQSNMQNARTLSESTRQNEDRSKKSPNSLLQEKNKNKTATIPSRPQEFSLDHYFMRNEYPGILSPAMSPMFQPGSGMHGMPMMAPLPPSQQSVQPMQQNIGTMQHPGNRRMDADNMYQMYAGQYNDQAQMRVMNSRNGVNPQYRDMYHQQQNARQFQAQQMHGNMPQSQYQNRPAENYAPENVRNNQRMQQNQKQTRHSNNGNGNMPMRHNSNSSDGYQQPTNNRSTLLEELRTKMKSQSSSRNRGQSQANQVPSGPVAAFGPNSGIQWGLPVILGQVFEFASDQHGSRYIQQQLESDNVSTADKEAVFEEVLPRGPSLCTDVFGNYVVQKLLDNNVGTPEQQHRLCMATIKGNMLELSLHMYGCRVVQKVVEQIFGKKAQHNSIVEISEQDVMLHELEKDVMTCVQDQNGNHVIQKCIEQIRPISRIQFILSTFNGKLCTMATHPYGCRVVQRVLEHCGADFVHPALKELVQQVETLVQDQYGNYVIQHIVQHGRRNYATQRQNLIQSVRQNLVPYATHKFASNVVEKCLQFGDAVERRRIIGQMLGHVDAFDTPVPGLTEASEAPPNAPLQIMMKDPYANYVVQKVLDIAEPDQLEQVVIAVRKNEAALKSLTYGKHILTRLEKINVQTLDA